VTDLGPIFIPGSLGTAATSVLQRWLPLYLATVERRVGLPSGTLPVIASWRKSGESIEKWPEDEFPALVAVSSGTDAAPLKDGDGIHRGAWRLSVAVLVDGGNTDTGGDVSPLDLAGYYGAAVRACLMHHSDLEGFGANGLTYVGEDYDETEPNARRTLGGARVRFVVDIPNIVAASAGPTGTPPDDPNVPIAPDVDVADVLVDLDPID